MVKLIMKTMDTINITTMTPERILQKPAFRRTIPADIITQSGPVYRRGSINSLDSSRENLRFDLMTQADFLREFDVNAHAINSLKYYPNPLSKDTDGKIYQKIKTRVAIAFQEQIFIKRLATLVNNNINLRIIASDSGAQDQQMLARFREGWELHNMENALYESIGADGKVGDVALCFYLSSGTVGWRVFSYEKGDVLYPHFDPMTGRLVLLGRKYSMMDEDGMYTEYLDVYDDTSYMRYRIGPDGDGAAAAWEVDIDAIPHNFPFIPVAYDRYGEPFWAKSQSLIEQFEYAISQLCENNQAYALRILYAFGAEMDMKSTVDGTPTMINSDTTDAKVGFLEPADASNSFTLQLKTLKEQIFKSSFAVETPELKSGSDLSSLTVKMLYADAYQMGLIDAQHFQAFIDDIIRIFKYGYGLESGMSSEFALFKVKGEIMPYIFMSETEEVANIVQLKGIGALSQKTASERAYEMGYAVNSEYDRVRREMEVGV